MIILSNKHDATGHVGLQSGFKRPRFLRNNTSFYSSVNVQCTYLFFFLKIILQVTVGVKKVFTENLLKIHIGNTDTTISKARKTQGKLV